MSDERIHHGHGHGHGEPGDVMDRAFWDERYRASPAVWSGQPNPQLVSEAAGLPPGAALDAGCGEGADAIWLAGRGWRVTAVDLSTVALERAAANARTVGVEVAERIAWLPADLLSWAPPASTYDLVSAQFLHVPKEQREPLFGRLAASVAPGGSFLVVGHDFADLQTTAPRPHLPEVYFTAADVAAALDPHDWDIAVSESRARTTLDPEGHTVTVHDAVLMARRRQ